MAILIGNDKLKDIEVHFLHYHSFDEANKKWEERKSRINFDKIYIIWSFAWIQANDELYLRAQSLPYKNKVIFVNHPIDNKQFPDFCYIKGFENQIGLGTISKYKNLLGERYYDQFDFVKWLNNN